MDIAGIRPRRPVSTPASIRPQLTGFGKLELTAYTPHGPIPFTAVPENGGHRVTVTLPEGCEGELLLSPSAKPDLKALTPDHPLGLKRYRLVSGTTSAFFVPEDAPAR